MILKNCDLFLAHKIITGVHVNLIKELYEELLDEIAPNALVLSEGFIYDEQILLSAIAKPNEKPYENLYNMAKRLGTLNHYNFNPHYLNTIRKASLNTYPKL